MDLPLFSEMLVRRRRELGYTTIQASRVLRIKENILVAFEKGDWYNIPKSGYAQGMLSSYARYLGLDEREVTQQFTRDLDEQERLIHESRKKRRNSSGRRQSRNSLSRRGSSGYFGSRSLLSSSYDYTRGREYNTSVSEPHIHGTSRSLLNAQEEYDTGRDRQEDHRDSYKGSDFEYDDSRKGQTSEARMARRQRVGYRPRVPVESSQRRTRDYRVRSSRSDHVMKRTTYFDDYVDDLQFNDPVDPYEVASTGAGRMGSRNIADPSRPNVRRRPNRSNKTNTDRSRRSRAGLTGLIGSDRGVNILIVLVLLVALSISIIVGVSSCLSNVTSTGRTTLVKNVESVDQDEEGSEQSLNADDQDSTKSDQISSTPSEDDMTTDSEGSGSQAQLSEKSEPMEVSVSVADGEITWVEITLDGSPIEAETKTGPWSQTYTVTNSIKVVVADPSIVTVTKNGEVQTFDKKASGVGTITIEGSPVADSDDTDEDDSLSEDYTTTDESLSEDYTDEDESLSEDYTTTDDDPNAGRYYDESLGLHYDDEGNYYDDYGNLV